MSYFPVKNYTQPFWLSEEDYISNYRSTLEIPKEQEIVIIGSGYAGTSTAYYLLKENPDLKITILEGRNVCSGATGRNGGHVKPYYHDLHDWVLEHYGLAEAAKNVEFEVRHLKVIKKLTEEENIKCDFILTRLCDIFDDDKAFKFYEPEIRNFLSNPYLDQSIKDSYQILEGEYAKTVSNNSKTNYAITAPSGHIWPWKFVTGLMKKIIQNPNVNLQANTMVKSFHRTEKGKYVICTDRGDTSTEKIVFATNGYTKLLLPEFNGVITPKKGTVTHIAQQQSPKLHLNFSSVIYFEDGAADYLINRPDGSIIVGGAEGTFVDPKEKYDTVDDSYNLKASEDYLRNYASKRFDTWRSAKTTNDYTWSGILSQSNDEFPYVGSLSELGYDNCFIIAGFSGHGMPRVLLSGKALLKSISTGGEPLQDIPECFKFSKKRMQKKFQIPHSMPYNKESYDSSKQEPGKSHGGLFAYLKSFFV